MTSSAMFRADKLRPLSTAELIYYLRDTSDVPVAANYWSRTRAGDAVKMKNLEFSDYSSVR